MTSFFSRRLWLSGLVLLLTACSATKQPEKIEYLFYTVAGDPLPINQVTDVSGKQVDLTDPSKRKLVILFATWCSDSQRALNALNQSDLLQKPDLEVIAIGREHTAQQLSEFQQKNNYQINMAADPDRSLYSRFANAGIPRFIMVGKDNVIIDHVVAEGEEQLSKIHWGSDQSTD